MKTIRLVSSDLNGTLVHQHTMMDMILVGFPEEPERFERAKDAFMKQTSGVLSMKEAFSIAGPLTKGLRLRTAIEYALLEMRFLDGFFDFIRTLREKDIRFVINSTGYSITTEVIKAVYGPEYFHDFICNRLLFGRGSSYLLDEKEISGLVAKFVGGDKSSCIYDEITAVGKVELGIQDESEKARLLFEIADRMKIHRSSIVHIGDTMGDSRGICEVARHGGIGIAFNYNDSLKTYLEEIVRTDPAAGEIFLISPKSGTSDIRDLLPIVYGAV
ncbi:MAG: hypothetical protein C4522_07120 [Desulfobacteraceae bacterium]|nr:MAG: hypothetical protein C4522_07120 [Desulfobacteraceae bacterium]